MVNRRDISIDLIILLVFAVIPFLFYIHALLIFNNAELYLNPVDLLHRVSYDWNAKVNLGGNMGWGMGGFFPMFSFFALFESVGLPTLLVDKMWLVFLLFLSGVSMYLLTSVVISKTHRLAKIIAALSYMYNLYVAVSLNGLHPFLTFYMALPAMLGIYIRSLNKGPDLKSAAVLTLVSLLMSAYNPTLILINFLVLFSYFLFHILANGTKNLKSIMKFNIAFIVAYVGLNLYWILPVINYSTTAWWSSIFSETLTMQNIGSSYVEVFRSLGYWGFYSGYKGVPYFHFSGPLLQNSLLITASLMVPLFAFLAVLFKPRDKNRLFFASLLIICIPMAVASYPLQNPYPLGKIYQWAYEHIPFFSVFRDNYKFVMPIALAYSALIGFLINDLYPFAGKTQEKLQSIPKKSFIKLRSFLVVLIISVLLINAWPLLTGNVIGKDETVKEIPQYWYNAAKWINNMPGDGGIFLMPEQYFPVYTWGKKAGNVNVALFNRPQVFEETTSGAFYPYSSATLKMAYAAIVNNETKYAGKILGLMGVEYILQRNDVDWTYYNVQSPSQVKSLLSYQAGISLQQSFGELDFYKNDYYVPLVYAADQAIYVNGSIDSLPSLSLMGKQDFNSSVLFFSESLPSMNNEILNYATDLVSTLSNSGNVPPYFTIYPLRGKFFESGAQGHISTVRIFAKNVNMTSDGYMTLSFSPTPGGPQIFSLNVTLPKGCEGWITAKVDKDWSFSSIFVYRPGDPYSQLGLDYVSPDGYTSDLGENNWVQVPERYYIGLEYTNNSSALQTINENSFPPEIVYKYIDPTEYVAEVNSSKPFFLVFSQSFQNQWEASINGQKISQHFMSNGYSNSWYINRTGSFEVTIRYAPQTIFDFSKIMSLTSFIILILIIIPASFYKRIVLRKSLSKEMRRQN